MIRGGFLSRPGATRGYVLAGAALLIVSFATGQERFRKSPPLPDPLQELRLPDFESYQLVNGMRVTVSPKSGSPIFLIQLIISAGLRHSPEDLPALASFTARMVSRGSMALSADDIETRIESMGGDFTVSTLMDYTVFTLRVLREELDPALDMLRAMALEPALREREIENVKRTMLSELRSYNTNPDVLGRRQLLRLLFHDHPYSRPGYNEDVIRIISQKDITEHYQRFYRSNNAEVLISGDIDWDTAIQKVSHYFGTWTRGETETPPLPPIEPNNRDRICFMEFPGIDDALVFVGNLTTTLTGEDYFPFLVLNHVLGGSTNSRLFMNLRESKGYAFNAFSDFEFYRLRGMYWAQARLLPEAVTQGVRAILAELRALATERIDPAEIEGAKAYLIGNLPLKFESPASFAESASRQIALKLGEGHWRGLSESLIRVNAEKVGEIARRIYSPKPVVIVLGRKERLLDGLQKDFDPLEVYDEKGALIWTFRKGEIK